jgi:N-acetylglucosamine-6-phosphate deacetylase
VSPPIDNEKLAICAERVFDGLRWHARSAVLIEGQRVGAICPEEELPSGYPMRWLPHGALLAPGFIDLQVNGGGGILLNDDPTPAAMRAIARAHRRFGTTALLPTLITDTREKIRRAIRSARETAGQEGILGLHLEGPFISPARAGVHGQPQIAHASIDDLEWLRELGQAGSSLMTLAPECVPEGFIRGLVDAGVRVAAGHSEASADVIARAIDEGLSGVTHLFNAMPPLEARKPGLVGAALADDRLTASLIVDGLHLDPVSVRAAFAAKGADGSMLVTDAMPTVGADIDEFQLTGRRIALREGRLVTEAGTLAGAHLDMGSAVRNAVTLCGVSLEEALRAASLTPAHFLGVARERGSLAAGARADLVALGPDLRVIASWKDGQVVETTEA